MKFKRSWGLLEKRMLEKLLNKRQSEFVQQHLHVKRC